VFFIYFLSDSV